MLLLLHTQIMKTKGFTLIELLVVISIIAILSTVVFVALNPVQRFQDARNSRRWSDVNNLLTAVHECIVDNGGNINSCLETGGGALVPGTVYEVVNTGVATGCNAVCAAATDDCATVDDELAAYLKSLPVDPQELEIADHTGYSVTVDGNGIVTIDACRATADGGTIVEVSR
jgi:prepilin-type N-terminal cleavage/methylation domain-containing protein